MPAVRLRGDLVVLLRIAELAGAVGSRAACPADFLRF